MKHGTIKTLGVFALGAAAVVAGSGSASALGAGVDGEGVIGPIAGVLDQGHQQPSGGVQQVLPTGQGIPGAGQQGLPTAQQLPAAAQQLPQGVLPGGQNGGNGDPLSNVPRLNSLASSAMDKAMPDMQLANVEAPAPGLLN